MVRFLPLILTICMVVPSHSETVKSASEDKVLQFIFNYYTAKLWTVKSGSGFIKAFGKDLTKGERELVLRHMNSEKNFPQVSQYENGWVFTTDGITVKVDIRKIRQHVVFLNDQKLVFDGREPLSHQIEVIRRKLFPDNEKYSWLQSFLLPVANADEGYLPGGMPLKRWVLVAFIWKGVDMLAESITRESVNGFMENFCWVTVDAAGIPMEKALMCRDYVKKQKEESGKNPSVTAVADGKKVADNAKAFLTLSRTCPQMTKNNVMKLTIAILDPDFLQKDKDGDYIERIIRTTSEQKGNLTVATYVEENRAEIAVYDYKDDKLKTIKIPANEKSDPKKVTMPYTPIPGSEELGKNDSVETKALQKFHQLVNKHVGAMTAKCTDDQNEREQLKKREALLDKDKAAK